MTAVAYQTPTSETKKTIVRQLPDATGLKWEDAEVGDPLRDLAKSRSEIVWIIGIAAGETSRGLAPEEIAANNILQAPSETEAYDFLNKLELS